MPPTIRWQRSVEVSGAKHYNGAKFRSSKEISLKVRTLIAYKYAD